MGIYEKLQTFQKKHVRVSRDAEAKIPGRNYRYSTLDNILSEVIPALNECGLVLVQSVTMQNEMLVLDTKIVASDDASYVESIMPLPEGVKPQDLGSAITYFRRYSVSALLGITSEDDDDAAAVSAPAKPKSVPVPPRAPAAAPAKLAFRPLLKSCQAKLLEAGFDYEEERVMQEIWDQMKFAFSDIVDTSVPQTMVGRGTELGRVLNIVGNDKFAHQLETLTSGHQFLPGQ